ncbi:hypothetical protein [Halomonas sp. PR-M31]|uniref:hypothetical protein n=1 Tax=Halomonas sp. PR-M31 TaxID=1471202 RepID=UPI0006506DDC|nr:hypothetical protein [Halomonas sp. PR-M31]
MGLMNPVLMLFTLVAPPLAGYLQDVTGSYHTAFLSFAIPLAAAILILPLIRFLPPLPASEPMMKPSPNLAK